jgi:Mg2+/Co2+ transporter CorB
VVFALNATANGILRLFGVRSKNEANSAFTLEQVEDIVSHSTRAGVLSDETGAITNTFEFTDKQVKDILVPIANLITVSTDVTPRIIEQAVAKHGFSRYIVLDEDGFIEGYLHLKDVIDEKEEEADGGSEKGSARKTKREEKKEAIQKEKDEIFMPINNYVVDILGKSGIKSIEDLKDNREPIPEELRDELARTYKVFKANATLGTIYNWYKGFNPKTMTLEPIGDF